MWLDRGLEPGSPKYKLDIASARPSGPGHLKCLLTERIIGPGHAKTCLISYASNKGADQPVHPCSLINTFVVCCLDSMRCILAISNVSRFWLASVAEQAGLNLTWSKIPTDTFLHDMA